MYPRTRIDFYRNRNRYRLRSQERTENRTDELPALREVFNFQNLRDVYYFLESEAGQAPDIDGRTWNDLSAFDICTLCTEIYRNITENRYRRGEVRNISFPKPQGGIRNISIPTIKDKIVFKALDEELRNYLEHRMLPVSYGFRSNISIERLFLDLESEIRITRMFFIGKADIEKAFDRVRKSTLLTVLKNWGIPQVYLSLIKKIIRYPSKLKGIEQGSSLSPLFLNTLLTEKLDRYFVVPDQLNRECPGERQDTVCVNHPPPAEGTSISYGYYRYADDLLFLGRNSTQVDEKITKAQERLLDIKMSLKGQRPIRDICKSPLVYLGFEIAWNGQLLITPSKASWDMLEENMLSSCLTENPETRLLETIQGWIAAKKCGLSSKRLRKKLIADIRNFCNKKAKMHGIINFQDLESWTESLVNNWRDCHGSRGIS